MAGGFTGPRITLGQDCVGIESTQLGDAATLGILATHEGPRILTHPQPDVD